MATKEEKQEITNKRFGELQIKCGHLNTRANYFEREYEKECNTNKWLMTQLIDSEKNNKKWMIRATDELEKNLQMIRENFSLRQQIDDLKKLLKENRTIENSEFEINIDGKALAELLKKTIKINKTA